MQVVAQEKSPEPTPDLKREYTTEEMLGILSDANIPYSEMVLILKDKFNATTYSTLNSKERYTFVQQVKKLAEDRLSNKSA